MASGCSRSAAQSLRNLTLSSKTPLDASLRRLKMDKQRRRLTLRTHAQLPFIGLAKHPLPKLLLDTTVYIDSLQDRLPSVVEAALRSGSIWHATVTEAELAALGGLLDPTRPETGKDIAQVMASLEQRPPHRILNPDRDVWREAGVLAGLVARLQGYGKEAHRRVLNDTLIFLTAAKHGCCVLTRNLSDFDLLLQLEPRGRVLFYDRA